jgi:hypothetical protein
MSLSHGGNDIDDIKKAEDFERVVERKNKGDPDQFIST